MSKKIRDIGEFPEYADWGEEYYCEICTDSGDLGTDLHQCPECGRWVCSRCWDKETGSCKICSKNVLSSSDSLNSKIKQLERRISALEKIVHTCPNCGALIVNPKAKFCGVCGERIS